MALSIPRRLSSLVGYSGKNRRMLRNWAPPPDASGSVDFAESECSTLALSPLAEPIPLSVDFAGALDFVSPIWMGRFQHSAEAAFTIGAT